MSCGRIVGALLFMLALSGCFGGCPAHPGGSCVPGDRPCLGEDQGFYCSIGAICTKPCGGDDTCRLRCDSAEDCGGTKEASSPWQCVSGFCACSGGVSCTPDARCVEGFCREACEVTKNCPVPPKPYDRRSGS